MNVYENIQPPILFGAILRNLLHDLGIKQLM
jgi:hypothetical protein